jgi:hypothetical protein
MVKYTTAQAKTIVQGLLSGRPPHYRPMPDAEFEARYDPQSAREKRLENLLEELIGAVRDLAAPPAAGPPAPHVYVKDKPSVHPGTVEL